METTTKLSRFSFSILILLTFSVFYVESQQQSFESNPYWHREILDTSGRYQLEWLVDWKQERVNFNVTVATTGFVGLGLARDGKMEGADIVVGGVTPEGQTYFSDRHAIGHQQPILDEKQDWTLHSGWENRTHTFLSFSRPFDTCDQQDVPITDDALYILWSFGQSDNLTYHFQNRGTYLAYLRDADLTPRSIHESNRQWITSNGGINQTFTPVERVADAQRWSVRTQFQVPVKRTTYWCNVKKFAPATPGKHHMIGYNVRMNPDALDVMHHMLLFRCNVPFGINPSLLYEPFVDKDGQECYGFDTQMGLIQTQFCYDLIAGHAIGGKPVFFPPHVGVSIGETNAQEYFLLQVHYDNPTARPNISADIHLDLYYTRSVRENDATIMSLGHHIPGSPSILLPPGEMNHRLFGHCSPSCTQKMLPPQGIKFVGGLLHTHVTGRRVRVHHFRGGRELPWILNDDNFKFQFQPSRLLRQEATVLPGDQVTVQCTYDTTLANKSVVGGYGTDQEMCKTFLLYYNKMVQYPICRSEIASPDYMARYLAGTRNVTWDNSRLEYVATFPLHLAGMTLSNISDSRYVNWDTELRNGLRRDHIVHPQRTVCPSIQEALIASALNIPPRPDFVTFPVETSEYRPPQRCILGEGA